VSDVRHSLTYACGRAAFWFGIRQFVVAATPARTADPTVLNPLGLYEKLVSRATAA